MIENIPVDITSFILGMFFYSLRSAVGKWMMNKLAGLLKRLLIKTEHDLAVYLHYRNKAYNKRHRH